jgi:AraC family transcriptional regulator, dual regulator of chb operon
MRCLTHDLPPGHVCTYANWQYTHYTETPALHYHDFHELFWVEEGEGFQIVNGERRPLTSGLLVLVRAEDRHGFSAARPGAMMRFINFAFPRSLWNELWRRRLGCRAVYFAEKDHRKREWILEPADLERLRVLSRDLAVGARDMLSAESLLTGIISLLAGLESRQISGRMPSWLSGSLVRMQEPRHFARGTPEFARLAGCTPEHLARALRQHLGRTPTEVVNEARLIYASQQLCTTERPILDIVADCGLENLGHFYKLFKNRFGTSPERYRRHAYLPVSHAGVRRADNQSLSPRIHAR